MSPLTFPHCWTDCRNHANSSWWCTAYWEIVHSILCCMLRSTNSLLVAALTDWLTDCNRSSLVHHFKNSKLAKRYFIRRNYIYTRVGNVLHVAVVIFWNPDDQESPLKIQIIIIDNESSRALAFVRLSSRSIAVVDGRWRGMQLCRTVCRRATQRTAGETMDPSYLPGGGHST